MTITIGNQVGGEIGGDGGKITGSFSGSVATGHTEGETEQIELGCCTASYWQYDFDCTCASISNFLFWGIDIFSGEIWEDEVKCTKVSEGLKDDDVTKYCPNCKKA
jgi:hypothetical protein